MNPLQHQVSSFHYSSKPPLYQASCKTQLTYMIIFLKFNLNEYFHLQVHFSHLVIHWLLEIQSGRLYTQQKKPWEEKHHVTQLKHAQITLSIWFYKINLTY